MKGGQRVSNRDSDEKANESGCSESTESCHGGPCTSIIEGQSLAASARHFHVGTSFRSADGRRWGNRADGWSAVGPAAVSSSWARVGVLTVLEGLMRR